MIPWLAPTRLDPQCRFPDLANALTEPNGLLAAGGDLHPNRLLAAYRHGIFPWYSDDQPILWWSPSPRMVLRPSAFKFRRSLRKRLGQLQREHRFELRFDTAFADVIGHCANAVRDGQDGTWITEQMQAAYIRLHQLGHAHSVEVWLDDTLAGGLYGIGIGAMFYGESMFTRVPDCSKIALAALVQHVASGGGTMIDCQQNTRHLASLGGCEIPREAFVRELEHLTRLPGPNWQPGVVEVPIDA